MGGFENFTERISKFLWLFAVVFCGIVAIAGLAGSRIGFDALLGILFLAIPFGVIAGLILAHKLLGPWLGGKLAFGLYSPEGNKPPPPEYPEIRAKIARGEYREAVEKLKNFLEKDPGNIHVVLLLSDVFIDKTKDFHNAIGLLNSYLDKEERAEEDVQFVMKLADVYLEMNAGDKAAALLGRELGMKYPKKELERIRNRLDGISRH